MKKLLVLAITLAMTISFTACGNDKKDDGRKDESAAQRTPAIEGVNDTAENVARAFYETIYSEDSSYEDLEKLIAPHEEYLGALDEEFFKNRKNQVKRFEVLSVEVTDTSSNYAEETIDEYANNLAENGYILEELVSVDLDVTVDDEVRVETIKKEVSAVKADGKWYIGVEYYIQ